MQELLKFGADPDTSQLRVGTYDTTPSYIALVYDHLDCFRSLFLAGADPEGTAWGRIEGPTPGFTSFYHVAVKHNARPVYVWLLRALGACMYRRDGRGRLACDVVSVDNASSYLIRQLLGNLTIHVSVASLDCLSPHFKGYFSKWTHSSRGSVVNSTDCAQQAWVQFPMVPI